jgi:glutamyl-tRNA synthetase
MTNYLALLGWSLSEDRDRFSLQEMADAFEIGRVNANPARFDLKKCTALNADWIRTLSAEDFSGRLLAYLRSQRAEIAPDESVVSAAAPLVQERCETLGQAADMVGFLLVDDDDFTVDGDVAEKMLNSETRPILEAAAAALESVGEWRAEAIESALRQALVEHMGLKPRVAFAPVRAAVSGRRVSPPLFESLEILGSSQTMRRLDQALRVS